MKMKNREELDSYYREAESWANDQRAALDRSRRIAWIVAIAAGTIAVLEALALMLLTPLKTVEPYTLLVDRQTGFVQALRPLNPERLTPDAALTQSFLVQYVIARESFDVAALQANYRRVTLWSQGRVRSGYIASVQASNPQSPLAQLPRSTVIETRVKSVTPIGTNAVMVRFDTLRRDAGAAEQPSRPWMALVRYRYTGAPEPMEDRFINPLGFEVVHYRRSAEAIEPASPPPQVVESAFPPAPGRRVPQQFAPDAWRAQSRQRTGPTP